MVIIEVSQIVADCVLTEIPGWIFLAPFNVLSVNVQSGYLLEPYSKSIWCALKYIYQTEGIAGLYKGNLYSIIHSIARRLCSVPLELSLLVIRQAILRRFTISLPIKKLITTFIFIFGFEQGYTYPVKYIRNSVMISGGSGFSKLLNILRTDGFIGLYTGIEGTYIGLIPGVFLCIYLQNILFPASKYHELVDTVELMESDDESEEDEEEDIFADIEGEPENNDEFENIEENDDGENGNANVDENDNENDIEDDVDELINELDDSERILARSEEAISKMNIRDWKVMLKLGMRVYVTKVLSTLSLKLFLYPGNVISNVMIANQVGFSTAATMIYSGSGVLGFFRGSLIELIIVPTKVAIFMGISICVMRYKLGGKLFRFFYPRDTRESVFENTSNRCYPGEQ